jgi:hypothetical protein
MEKKFQKDIQRVKTCTDEQHGFHKCEQTVLKEDNQFTRKIRCLISTEECSLKGENVQLLGVVEKAGI